MTSADITALRAQACRVIAELGQALACLEDAEGLLYAEGLETMKAMGQTGSHAAAALLSLVVLLLGIFFLILWQRARLRARLQAAADRLAQERAANESRRWESLGFLSAGLAHDFNNLLTVIMGNAGLTAMLAEPGSEVERAMHEIKQACQTASARCRQMLQFAGKEHSVLAPLDVLGPLHAAAAAVRPSFPNSRITLPENSLPLDVLGNREQLVQLFRNLLTNAAESIGDKPGAIQVHCRKVNLTAADCRAYRPAPSPGPAIEIELHDNRALTGGGSLKHEWVLREKMLPR